MDIKIGLIGATGRLGAVIASLHPVIPIPRNRSNEHEPCDVIIDVSSPSALLENLALQKPLVIGTTGHLNLQLMKEAAQDRPIFYAPTFTL